MASSDYAPTDIDGVMHVWLQGIGWYRAKPLSEVEVGDTIVYNYGVTSTVIEKRMTGKKSVVLVVESLGKRYEWRVRRLTSLVATK